MQATKRLYEVFDDFRPEAVVNAAGVIKQRKDTTDARQMLEINAVFPRRLLNVVPSLRHVA